MLRVLAEPYLKWLSNEANSAHVAEIGRVFSGIEADRRT
jgi:hypothetical protein